MEKNKMKKLLEMLKRHEGEVVTNGRHVAYKCPAGYWTVGVGRNVDPNGGIGLSDEEVDMLLENDIARVIKELASEYSWFKDLDSVRAEAVINAFFCLGATKFRGFQKMIQAFETADYKEASVQLLDSRFAKQTGRRAIELADMIATGEYV